MADEEVSYVVYLRQVCLACDKEEDITTYLPLDNNPAALPTGVLLHLLIWDLCGCVL
jgi:hypothetical protein